MLLPSTALVLLHLVSPRATALINVSFTPVELVRQADAVVAYTVTPNADTCAFRLQLVELLKGKDPQLKAIDASALASDEDIAVWLEEKSFTALVFTGRFGAAKRDAESSAIAAMHLGRAWYGIVKAKDGTLALAEDRLDLKAVWDGGTGPLRRAVGYVLSSPTASIPATAGVRWESVTAYGRIEGKVGPPVWAVDGDAPRLLYPSSAGDVLVTVRKGKLELAAFKTRSAFATRADLDADGNDEWIGCDGRSVYAIGRGAARPIVADLPGTLALRPVALRGKPAVLAVTASGPVLIERAGEGFTTRRLLKAKLEDIRDAKVFDTNDDGLADLVLIGGKKLYVATARRGGGYAPPRVALELYDLKLRRTLVADFDGDGRPDILLVGADQGGVDLLAGDGKGGFRGAVSESGELGYHARRRLAHAALGDVNNDGLIDVVITPVAGAPFVMFSRGFRTFGIARELDVVAAKLDGAEHLLGEGDTPGPVTSAVLIDLDGDGAQDMLCHAGGRLVAVRRAPGKRALGVRVSLRQGIAGPAFVSATAAARRLGGVLLDSACTFRFGRTTPGPVDLAWTLPSGAKGAKRVIVLRPTTLTIGE